MVTIHVETIGDERFVRGFSRFLDEIKDFSPVFEMLFDDFQQVNAKNFSKQGTPEAWKPLSPDYAEWKAKVRPGRPILVFDGHLKAALTGISPFTIKKIGKHEAEFGTSLPYADYHQTGRGRLPRRKPVQITEADKVRWSKIIHRWAYEKIERV